jgi:osmotically-inducible protein OsmY
VISECVVSEPVFRGALPSIVAVIRIVSRFRDWRPTPKPKPVIDGSQYPSGSRSAGTDLRSDLEKTMSYDSQLQQAVLSELAWEPSVTAAHIGVAAKAGVVTLSGHVENFVEKHAAEAAARRVKGVKALVGEIEVRLAFDKKRDDEEIAAAALDRLAWDVSVPQDAVEVEVENGWITLTGQVDWNYQREAAEQDIRPLFGVTGVSNQIKMKPKVNASNLSDDITHALHRSWFFDPKTIAVTAVDGRVRLTGTVHTWHDRQLAESTAWAAPGATAVENNIAVV